MTQKPYDCAKEQITQSKLQWQRDWIPKRKRKPKCPSCKRAMKRLYDRSGHGGSKGWTAFPAYGCRECFEVTREG